MVDLNYQEAQIKEMPDMNVAREEFVILLGPDGKLYAIGGFNTTEGCLDSLEVFDFALNRWEIVGKMNNPRRALNAVTLPDGVYVMGGYNGEEYLNSV